MWRIVPQRPKICSLTLIKQWKCFFTLREICCSPPPPKCLADPFAVDKAVQVLSDARKPLVIIGKGTSQKKTSN